MGIDEKSKIKIGVLKKGKRNLITDVEGVKVGHVTLDDGNIKTGVTAILPHDKNLFKEKVMASSYTINGFGKSIGLVQIEELGTIETPIIMTNTLSVGTASTALVKYMLKQNEDIGVTTGTVNCIVTECNDGTLNDIRGLHIKEEHIFEAINSCSDIFEEGAVGSGTGMVCFGLKGGIGSSSRIVELDNKEYTLGSIVMSNFGSKKDLTICGQHIGKDIVDVDKKNNEQKINNELSKSVCVKNNLCDDDDKDKGSIIIIIATDIPLSERQLKRVSKRATISLGRMGSHLGNGSGDICISFTTANKINHYQDNDITQISIISDNIIDKVFRAAIESVEESILSSMTHSKQTVGIREKCVESINKYI